MTCKVVTLPEPMSTKLFPAACERAMMKEPPPAVVVPAIALALKGQTENASGNWQKRGVACASDGQQTRKQGISGRKARQNY